MNECVQCGKPTGDSHKTCANCRAVRQASGQRRREYFRARGLCTRCGGKREDWHLYCKRCREAEARTRREVRHNTYLARSIAGLCVRCGAPATHGCRCEVCHAKDERARKGAVK